MSLVVQWLRLHTHRVKDTSLNPGQGTRNPHAAWQGQKQLFVKISFLFTYFSLKDNCFTEFCCFLSNLKMNQPYLAIMWSSGTFAVWFPDFL